MDRRKVIAKVIRCLALAQAQGASPNEAETALRQARALMRQYDLPAQELTAHTLDAACVPTQTRRPPRGHLLRLAALCAHAFDCQYLACFQAPSGWVMKFLGRGIAPEMAAHAYSALHHQLVFARRQYAAALPTRCSLKTRRRRAQLFVEGWLDAVGAKVALFASGPDAQTRQAIDAYLALAHPGMTEAPLSRTRMHAHDACAVFAGWQQGQSAQLRHGVHRDTTDLLSGDCP
ncbi:DUF2786 domain-containing protein [Pseudomonas protegens]|uniref:DUF2786 domain-containing protein n=1 Tax=Pseudomonas protegens TaxID=380021 RepID=A0A2T6GB50_9PSED|nr:DUF2786 domain-containing protein [Pseudomonas protegens]PUA41386.1 DUF2786 domain-containing protein [Pseudomonas protegens]